MTPDRSRATASASEPQPDQQTGERSASTELRPDESGTDGAIEALKLDVQNLGSLVRDLESKVSQTKSQMSEIVQLLNVCWRARSDGCVWIWTAKRKCASAGVRSIAVS